jgi:predicted DNA-binding transcriptional regulator AlpA
MTKRLLKAKEIAALLGVSRATFYRIPFFRRRKVRVSERAVRYSADDLATYLHSRAA